MEPNDSSIEDLKTKIRQQEIELNGLKSELEKASRFKSQSSLAYTSVPDSVSGTGWPLKVDEYKRYGRQMIIPEARCGDHSKAYDTPSIGQLKLRGASVLIVGVGGLGCPASAYIAGAGIGTLGLVDGDIVEVSNLHRQILHTTSKVGLHKVESAAAALKELNPNVRLNLHPQHLDSQSAVKLFSRYDVVLDCTDHPTSRYLISDAAVLARVPLVSASALKTDGQLLVLNNPPKTNLSPGGPCYRCIFPKPPAPETVLSCGEGGIMGPVVGVMGVLMAVEVLKILTSKEPAIVQQSEKPEPHPMLIYSAYSPVPFRSLKLRGKRSDCVSCSAEPSITEDSLNSGSLDYAMFCGLTTPINTLRADERVTASQYAKVRFDEPHVLLDVRDETQFGICSLRGSINIPFTQLDVEIDAERLPERQQEAIDKVKRELASVSPGAALYTICRFGNDSQLVVEKLKRIGFAEDGKRWIGDIEGGFSAWKREIDPLWPEY